MEFLELPENQVAISLWALVAALTAFWLFILSTRDKFLSRDRHENRVTTGSDNHIERLKKYRRRFAIWIAFILLLPVAIQILLFTMPSALKAPIFVLQVDGEKLPDGSFIPVIGLMIDQTLKGAVFDFFEVWGIDVGIIEAQKQSFAVKAVIATYRLIVIKVVIDLLIVTAALTFDLWFKKNLAGIGGYGRDNQPNPIFTKVPLDMARPLPNITERHAASEKDNFHHDTEFDTIHTKQIVDAEPLSLLLKTDGMDDSYSSNSIEPNTARERYRRRHKVAPPRKKSLDESFESYKDRFKRLSDLPPRTFASSMLTNYFKSYPIGEKLHLSIPGFDAIVVDKPNESFEIHKLDRKEDYAVVGFIKREHLNALRKLRRGSDEIVPLSITPVSVSGHVHLVSILAFNLRNFEVSELDNAGIPVLSADFNSIKR